MKDQNRDRVSDIWAIILAAGESRRMNSPKMLLPFRGSTIIGTVLENVLKSEIKNILIVLGSSHNEIAIALSGYKVKTCLNNNFQEGMLSSVKCGFRSVPDNFSAAVVLPGDQPMIPPQVLNAIVNSWRNTGSGIIIPLHNGKRGHPILIDSKYKLEVEKLTSDEGLHALPVKFKKDVMEIEMNTPEILRDIDTRDDYLKELNQN
jgi:molybdenum cofactor cytidylyltransferase